MLRRSFVLLLLVSAFAIADEAPQRPKMGKQPTGVYRDKIEPHWFADNTRFWYRNDGNGTREFILVDALKGTRGPAFDHQKLADALTKAGERAKAERLPIDQIEFIEDGKALRFRIEGVSWKCDLGSYECTKSTTAFLPSPGGSLAGRASEGSVPPSLARPANGSGRGEGAEDSLWPDGLHPDIHSILDLVQKQRPGKGSREAKSPDGKITAFVKDSNVFTKNEAGQETQLSKDGASSNAYGLLAWSPDGKGLIAWRIEPGERKEVHVIRSSPKGGGRATLESRPYALPGDKFTGHELNVFDVVNNKQVKPDVGRVDFGTPNIRWKADKRHFTYQKIDRGHQRLRIIEVDSHTGNTRDLIDEKTKTFIWTAHTQFPRPARFVPPTVYLDDSEDIIHTSDADGWKHLYLYDSKSGKLKHQITKGEWVMRGMERIDEKARQIWFRASGKNVDHDPYLLHHYRIDFDGKNLVALTEGNGTHTIEFSPDRKYLIDRYSRADMPAVHELRRAEDGKLVVKLEEADITELKKSGWEAPEVFSAPGRDGKTGIWGLIYRPRGFDASKKYPVIEHIYAGPHDSHVPKAFSASRRFSALTDLGFVVVQIDGMGTANRSKAFHDVCWQNLKDAGFPDRVLWHKAVAAKYPWYDATRVGIYGTSAGGQNAMGALLFHGDFYKAAVAACGCHDNRMDKASWNEQWMGYPVGKHYAESSNVDNAHRLRGKLLLIVGEVDENVPPESTLRVVSALITANKDFDFLLMPNVGHSDGGLYGQRRLQDFFVRHLQGKEPPDRNAGRKSES